MYNFISEHNENAPGHFQVIPAVLTQVIKNTDIYSDKQENNALFWAADDCTGDNDNGWDDAGRGLQLCLRYGESVSAGARLRQQDMIFFNIRWRHCQSF